MKKIHYKVGFKNVSYMREHCLPLVHEVSKSLDFMY